jgi:hypothetical protein
MIYLDSWRWIDPWWWLDRLLQISFPMVWEEKLRPCIEQWKEEKTQEGREGGNRCRYICTVPNALPSPSRSPLRRKGSSPSLHDPRTPNRWTSGLLTLRLPSAFSSCGPLHGVSYMGKVGCSMLCVENLTERFPIIRTRHMIFLIQFISHVTHSYFFEWWNLVYCVLIT